MKYIYFFILIGINLFFLSQSLPAYAQIDNLSCQGISLSASSFPNHNGMSVYKGNEIINIIVTGSASTNNIELYWIPAYKPVTISANWNKINGSYNTQTHIFTAVWNLNNDQNIQGPTTGKTWPQEIILAANNFGSSGFCSGNACSSQYPKGAYWANGGGTVCASAPASGCSGCQKKIVIDPTVDLNASNAIDLKEYMLLNPGNYWEYEGTNYTYSVDDPSRLSKTRIEIEPPTIMCNHKAVGMRFLKDKASGYWGEKFSYFDPGRWGGSLAFRNSMFYFDNDAKWSNRFTGSPWFTTFNLLDAPNQFKGLGAIPTNPAFGYTTSGSQHFYYSPYLYAPRYLPADPTAWKFKREDVIYTPAIAGDSCKYENEDPYKNDYITRGHGWETKYGWENVQTPAYSGKALRIIFLEYGDPVSGFLLREDYFFAENIGLVMIRVKDIFQKSKHDTSEAISRNNCGSQCDDNLPMVDPMLAIKLKNYYLGTPLTISSSVIWVKPQSATTYWPVNFSDQYTGFIDYTVDQELPDGTIKHLGSGYWTNVWVQDGLLQAPVPSDVLRGKFIYKFRRHLPDLPSGVLREGETVDIYTNNLPWSNTLSVSFTDVSPVSGDLDGDGDVDIFDYNILVANFGNPYTIFDYNILVGNFGSP